MKWWWLRLIRDFCPDFLKLQSIENLLFWHQLSFQRILLSTFPSWKNQKISSSHLSMTGKTSPWTTKSQQNPPADTSISPRHQLLLLGVQVQLRQSMPLTPALKERIEDLRRPKYVFWSRPETCESTKTGDRVETGKIAVNKKNTTKRNTGSRTKNKFHDYI